MSQSPARILLSRFIGGLIVLGAVVLLLMVTFFSLGYGIGIPALLPGLYLFVLLMLGIGAMLAQSPARLALSILLPLQACWLIAYVIYKTPRPGQVCDASCYAMPLEAIAAPVALSLIAAWVLYPGRRTAE